MKKKEAKILATSITKPEFSINCIDYVPIDDLYEFIKQQKENGATHLALFECFPDFKEDYSLQDSIVAAYVVIDVQD